MRMRIYNLLVNRHSGIRSRYHKFHDNGGTARKLLSYLYLIGLNFAYYILFCRFLDKPSQVREYEEKRLFTTESESAMHRRDVGTAEEFAARLDEYDVVSFDIFDTLIFRPFSAPGEQFYFLGEGLGILDCKRIRMGKESLCRRDRYSAQGHYEVTLSDIWERIEKETGIPAKQGMQLELDVEEKLCYGNPFMLEVFHILLGKGKTIIAVSDMYLPGDFLGRLLEKNGYMGISRLYISCEYNMGKRDGGLFERVKEDYRENASIVHVGDNLHSDVKMAVKSGFASIYYPNINKMALSLRPYDMSPVIGGAYRGIVDAHLYQGTNVYSMEYEYGFVYGGLFVLGYCHFIHDFCRRRGVDKLLFLSRDGDILKQVYDRIYPGENTVYVYWSRTAAVKLMAEHDHHDYFRRHLHHRRNKGIPIREILLSLDLGYKELEQLTARLPAYVDQDAAGRETGIILHLEDELKDQNVKALARFLLMNFEIIADSYRGQGEAAKEYYSRELAGAGLAAAVDIGWAGSGALSLSYLAERVWKLPCEIVGIIAGTNTVHNVEPDASEIFLQSGRLTAYLFSQSHNRDLMKKHDLNKDYNLYWELLLASPSRPFLGFGLDEKGEVKLHFGREEANQEGIREIQKGILDFAENYCERFRDFPFMLDISGRDAYAPMLLAAGHNEKYLKAIAGRFSFEKGLGSTPRGI